MCVHTGLSEDAEDRSADQRGTPASCWRAGATVSGTQVTDCSVGKNQLQDAWDRGDTAVRVGGATESLGELARLQERA